MNRSLNLLDLAIILTSPPVDAPPNAMAEITLRCEKLRLRHEGGFLVDPLTAEEWKELRWYLEEYWKQFPEKRFEEDFVQRIEQVRRLLPELGMRLYKQVFSSEDAVEIVNKWLERSAQQHQLSIISDIPKVLSLPWELLHGDDFLALRHQVSLVRRLQQNEQRAYTSSLELPLRVLLVTARPEGVDFVDPRIIARELFDEMQEYIEEGKIFVEFLRPPTLDTLSQRLTNANLPPIHVLHFDGHGEFDEREMQGKLFFEKKDYGPDPVTAEYLFQILRGTSVRLVVLTSCQSTMGSENNIFSSVTTGLIKCGIDAVVGMSASVVVPSAVCFVEAFYRTLLYDPSGLFAQWQARRALYTNKERYLLSNRRGQEAVHVELHDWWVPHYYQRRPLVLQLRPPNRSEQVVFGGISANIPDEPRYGFSGRSRELLQVERYLLQKKLVVVHGFAGIGKTALICDIADWLRRTGMYTWVYYVNFEHDGKDALLTIKNLKQGLEVEATETKIKNSLVIVDGLESILSEGGSLLKEEERSLLWDVLLNLARKGMGVLLASSDMTIGDGRLVRGERVAHLFLKELRSWDAYALATRVLISAGVNPKRVSFQELRDLLAYLDHHPLVIQLVLPLLRERSLTEVKTDLAKLLPECVDSTTQGHHHSLIDLLAGPLQRLSRLGREMLHRLAFFEGGACEDNLMKITALSQGEWSELRSLLECVELLMTEQIHQDITVPYIRFHPVLTLYLRGQPRPEYEDLHLRYIQRYNELTKNLYHPDKRCLDCVQALVRRELPNLKHTVALLLKLGNLDEAFKMAESICWFLKKFGRVWEHDALQQLIAEATVVKVQGDGKS